jgi:hypothetical protein
VIADTLVIAASRMKSKAAFAMPITAPVMELFGPPPAVAFFGPGGEGFIFSADGTRPFAGYSRPKAALDLAIAALRERDGRGPMEPRSSPRTGSGRPRRSLTPAGAEVAPLLRNHHGSRHTGVM